MKKILLHILLIATVFSLSACGVFNQENPQVEQEEPQVTQEKDNGENKNEESITKEATGIYIGQIDSNAVEINIDNEPKAFVITEVEREINKLEENEDVRLKYIENEYGQLILKEIEIKK